LTSIWRLSHPDSRSPDDPFAEDSDSVSPSSGSFSDGDGSISEEDENLSVNSNVSEEGTDEETVKPKAATTAAASEQKGTEMESGAPAGDTGPESHDKTECDCGKDGHFEKVVCDEIIKAPLGKVWNCVYGEGKDFMMSFLRDNQKVQGIYI
jgi:hypothetical protein